MFYGQKWKGCLVVKRGLEKRLHRIVSTMKSVVMDNEEERNIGSYV